MVNNIKFKNFIIFCFLGILIFLTQFSSLDREVIDWDESTFAVISKGIVDGEILYVDLWDESHQYYFIGWLYL